MPIQEYEVITFITVVILVIIIAGFFIFILVAFANRRKRIHMQEKETMTHSFQQEILKAQLEIQEKTLNNISQEIHDNIGQVLSLAKINLVSLDETLTPLQATKIKDTRLLISKAIQDLRDLSRTINPEYIMEMGLNRLIEFDLEIIGKTGLFSARLQVEGEIRKLDPQKELILFRMVQELLNNAMKHSGAASLEVMLTYHAHHFMLLVKDDGAGFDPEVARQSGTAGLGIKNIQNRAALIGAKYELKTEPGYGTTVTISLNE
jgi:signal transduction histidine kinase